MQYSPDNSLLLAVSADTIYVLSAVPDRYSPARVNLIPKFLLSDGQPQQSQQQQSQPLPIGKGGAGDIQSLSISSDSRFCIAVDRAYGLHYWDIKTGRRVRPESRIADAGWASWTACVGWSVAGISSHVQWIDGHEYDDTSTLALPPSGDASDKQSGRRQPHVNPNANAADENGGIELDVSFNGLSTSADGLSWDLTLPQDDEKRDHPHHPNQHQSLAPGGIESPQPVVMLSKSKDVLVVGESAAGNTNRVQLFRYPVLSRRAQSHSYFGHVSRIQRVAFSYDDHYLLTSGAPNESVTAQSQQPQVPGSGAMPMPSHPTANEWDVVPQCDVTLQWRHLPLEDTAMFRKQQLSLHQQIVSAYVSSNPYHHHQSSVPSGSLGSARGAPAAAQPPPETAIEFPFTTAGSGIVSGRKQAWGSADLGGEPLHGPSGGGGQSSAAPLTGPGASASGPQVPSAGSQAAQAAAALGINLPMFYSITPRSPTHTRREQKQLDSDLSRYVHTLLFRANVSVFFVLHLTVLCIVM